MVVVVVEGDVVVVVVDAAVVVVEDVVDDVGAVVVVETGGASRSKSGVIQYSDSAYNNVGRTAVGEYPYKPFPAPADDAGAIMHPDGETTVRFWKPCNVYA